jgi:ADP-ribose pyrophosphatase
MGKNADRQKHLEQESSVDSRTVHEGYMVEMRSDLITPKQGKSRTWDVIIHPGAVAMVPITDDGRIILVEQWRRAAGVITLEIPAGTLEDGEGIEECAQKELQEEIGFKAKKLLPMGEILMSPGISTEIIYLFLANDLEKSVLTGDDSEWIDVVEMSQSDVLKKIKDGTICDAKTVVGILKYFSMLA